MQQGKQQFPASHNQDANRCVHGSRLDTSCIQASSAAADEAASLRQQCEQQTEALEAAETRLAASEAEGQQAQQRCSGLADVLTAAQSRLRQLEVPLPLITIRGRCRKCRCSHSRCCCQRLAPAATASVPTTMPKPLSGAVLTAIGCYNVERLADFDRLFDCCAGQEEGAVTQAATQRAQAEATQLMARLQAAASDLESTRGVAEAAERRAAKV